MSRTLNVLIIDDDLADIELTRIALSGYREGDFHIKVHEAHDGEEGLSFIRDESKPTPDIVLLDLNMPRKDGRTTLNEIRTDEKLKNLPVAVLTTSDSQVDIKEAYKTGCTCFITKPVGIEEFQSALTTFSDFWFSVVKWPDENHVS